MFDPYERVAEDSPERCKGSTKFGQCRLIRQPESEYCIMHGGAGVADRKAARNYTNTLVQQKLESLLATPDQLHTLYEEIALLRLALNTILDRVYRTGTTEAETLLEFDTRLPTIVEIIDKIGKIVPVSNKLETHYQHTVGKAELLQFAGDIVKIIAGEIDDETVLRTISDKILNLLN